MPRIKHVTSGFGFDPETLQPQARAYLNFHTNAGITLTDQNPGSLKKPNTLDFITFRPLKDQKDLNPIALGYQPVRKTSLVSEAHAPCSPGAVLTDSSHALLQFWVPFSSAGHGAECSIFSPLTEFPGAVKARDK